MIDFRRWEAPELVGVPYEPNAREPVGSGLGSGPTRISYWTRSESCPEPHIHPPPWLIWPHSPNRLYRPWGRPVRVTVTVCPA